MPSESVTRKEIIDLRLKEAGWSVSDPTQVIEEYFLSPPRNDDNATDLALDKRSDQFGPREFSDYVLLGKNGKPVAVVEAKQSSKSAELGREQAKQYCQNIQANHDGELPFCFYTNGHEIFFWNLGEAQHWTDRSHGSGNRPLRHYGKATKPSLRGCFQQRNTGVRAAMPSRHREDLLGES